MEELTECIAKLIGDKNMSAAPISGNRSSGQTAIYAALAVGFALTAFACMFPPWEAVYQYDRGTYRHAWVGFHFIGVPPDDTVLQNAFPAASRGWLTARIVTPAWLGIVVASVFLTGAGYFACRCLKPSELPKARPPAD